MKFRGLSWNGWIVDGLDEVGSSWMYGVICSASISSLLRPVGVYLSS